MDSIYGNPDGDPEGLWDSKKTGGNPTASSGDAKSAYGIQSPFTGEMHYPGSNYWRSAKASMKAWLEEWGSEYEEKIIDDNVVFINKVGKQTRVKALVLKGCKFLNGQLHIPVENEHLFRFKMNADSGLRVHHFRTPQSTNSDVR
ncbi:hypothetical protein, partial [Aeromonas caviae]